MGSKSRNQEIIVDVADEDVERAIPKDSSHCMIADALKRARPDVQHVSVDLATIRWSDPRTRKRYIALTPRQAQIALLDFDKGEKPKPFMFRVRPSQIVTMRQHEGSEKKPAKLSKVRAGGNVPVVQEGATPPRGPLAGGAGIRTGRRREFGLRGMGR